MVTKIPGNFPNNYTGLVWRIGYNGPWVLDRTIFTIIEEPRDATGITIYFIEIVSWKTGNVIHSATLKSFNFSDYLVRQLIKNEIFVSLSSEETVAWQFGLI